MTLANYLFGTSTKFYVFIAISLLFHTVLIGKEGSALPIKTISTKEIIKAKDHVMVVKNNSVIFELLQTEEDAENPVSIRVIEQPKFGEVTLGDDQSFKYAPLHNLCEKDDLVIYEMVSENQIVEVSVHIEILCESLTIMNGMGMAPKNDEEEPKDSFTILGIEQFPNNSLHIFDDNGNQVFEKENYANDWNGVLEDGEKIEKNRMYYYVFNDGDGNFYSGYLHIN